MADPQTPFSQNQQSVPPPPTPVVPPIRTMQSDLDVVPRANTQIEPKQFLGEPTREPSFTPQTENLIPDTVTAINKPHRSKTLLWVIVGIIVIAGLAAVGAFVVYPKLMGSKPTQAPLTTGGGATTPPPPVIAPHTSAFVIQPSVTFTIEPTTLEAITVIGLLQAQGELVGNKNIAEVVIKNTNGQIPFATYLSALLPGFLDASTITTWLADDFTAFLYKDEKGVWPGYIVKIKPDANQETFAQWIAAFEKNDLAGLFVTAPGQLAAFKNGTYKTINDRYALGSNGASLSYAIINGSFVINTSYDGLKEAVRLLGL